MRPEWIITAVYLLFGAWMYNMGMQGRKGNFKFKNAYVLRVMPGKKTDIETYKGLYLNFHRRIFLLSVVMGIFCMIVKGLFPVVAGSLFFFGYLNLYKVKTEDKLVEVCGGIHEK